MTEEEERGFAPPEEEGSGGREGDYVFRFRMDRERRVEGGYEDPLLELIRGQLADLLDAVVLTHRGQRIQVDGFRLLQDPDTQYEIWPAKGREPGAGGGRRAASP